MTKFERICKLSDDTALRVTKNGEEWMQFLDTAARVYRYPFQDQLLIYAQYPQATACASIKLWNEKMLCWVNRGSEGIALIDSTSKRPRLKYVFDVSKVHRSRRGGRYPHLWKMQPEHEQTVLNRLEQSYGGLDPKRDLEINLFSLADRIARERYEDLRDEIGSHVEGSFLEGLDDLSLGLRIRETLSASIAYMVLCRCGADMDLYRDRLNFSYIHEFSGTDLVGFLGGAVAEACEPLLKEIGRTVDAYDLQKSRNTARKIGDRESIEGIGENAEKGLANASENGYSLWQQESVSQTSEKEEQEHGTEIRQERRLPDTEPVAQRGAGGTIDEVWSSAPGIPEDRETMAFRSVDPVRETEAALSGYPGAGGREDGGPGRTDGEGGGSGRSPQGIGSDALGAPDEQHPEPGGGDRTAGDRVQHLDDSPLQRDTLEYMQMSLFPSFEEQVGTIAAAEVGEPITSPAAFSLPEEQLRAILRSGGGKKDSRKRIFAKYRAGYTPEQMVAFLQQEYASTGKGFTLDGHPVSVWFDERGMRAGYGNTARDAALAMLSWEDVERHIRAMIEQGTYMTAQEAYLVDPGERNRLAGQIYYFFEDGMGQLPGELDLSVADYHGSRDDLAERLSTPEGRQQIKTLLEEAAHKLASGEATLKFHYVKEPEYLLSQIEDLGQEWVKYPLAETLLIPQEDFITQDEIDHALRRGSGFSHGTFRIYDFFLEDPSPKEAIAFLKKEYGVGGGTGGLPGNDSSYNDHDAKGIRLMKGTMGTPYVKVLLNWTVVEKRLRELIREDRYLSAEQKQEYQEYKQEKEEAARQQEIDRLEKGSEDQTLPEPVAPEAATPVLSDTGKLPAESSTVHTDGTDPEPSVVQGVNFRLHDDHLGEGTPREKFQRNVDAIRTLKRIEQDKRPATLQEQQILSGYVGWGGLSEAFDESRPNWSAQYQQLKELLSPEEYRQARESVLNAHYTSPVIIRQIYDTLARMGFGRGNVLEPSMGIGNFFGMLPDSMRESRLYGVELDSITGRIAKLLYPQADVQITGFEQTEYPDDFFDVAIGNVPFGQYKVSDRRYDKHNFLIHDYFFAKTLDLVRPGGVIAFITSKGTMDKASPEVRRYLAGQADLLGAVRLPNTAFKANAGTEVTSDILFFQKRDRMVERDPDWVYTGQADGIAMNSYFADHPEQIVGKMAMVSGPYGMESTCQADTGRPFEEQLSEALHNIGGRLEMAELEDLEEQESQGIPADPTVKNFSFAVIDDEVYYRENSVMTAVDVSATAKERIKGMVALRDCTRELIDLQLADESDTRIKQQQDRLNSLYDGFYETYGQINSQANRRAFAKDNSYCLLCSLERLDEQGEYLGKADMFTKRTIKKAEVVTHVETASEALAVSLGEKAGVDLEYMSDLCGKTQDAVKEELTGVIFRDPVTQEWETADAYLSGNVREKLATAREYATAHPEYAINVQALTRVMPEELEASQIEVRLGATWIDPGYIEDFMRETFQTPSYLFQRNRIGVRFAEVTGQWQVKGKSADSQNPLANTTYGSTRRNAYQILEDSLNLKDSQVYDTVEEDGRDKRVLNKKETMIASQRQEAVREAFRNWIFRDPERRQTLVARYNELFNSVRPREYDGSHLRFPGMNPEIELKPHQKNAVSHILYGKNTLLAHCVGAGKTYEMAAAAMESKRLGLCRKSLFVVPNHLTQQWASEFLQLYPGANILAATKKDFEPANRKKFCSRIATGDYDAVIIGHSQFERIPLSAERRKATIEREIEEIETAIEQIKRDNGERYTIKQMERSRKSLQVRLDKLNDQSRKDDVVTFEQLGVDRLFVDESHNYKNLFLYTKMTNVAGISQTESQKSSDMLAKCRYLDELTGGRGVTFATGTPISNSMTELYTNMRYLQNDTLTRLGLSQFDAWAASFGETQTVVELAPEGTGYRPKTRFARFFNLPELISLFKESADIQTADMLKLPVPEAEYENMVLKPSEHQKEMVASLAERAEAVRNRQVDAKEDNMLKITTDGRKLALDQRLLNPMLPDDPNSKAAACVQRAYAIWEDTKKDRLTQLIFCDLSTPKGDGSFNIYEDIKAKLVAKGVPAEEIAFIHDANTDTRKKTLFAQVRAGQVRFLIGSTQKMGAGTNVQDRLIALHHLDVPWRPSDIEQQEGRILRQGNKNEKVKIFRYLTEGTFDSYSWQVIENKQKFISQIMTSKSPVRSCDDVDETALTYAEVKALATGNPHIKEKMDLDIQVAKLRLLKANHTSQKYRLEDNIAKHYPKKIALLEERIRGLTADIDLYHKNLPADPQQFALTVANKTYDDKKEAGAAIIAMCKEVKGSLGSVDVGSYLGFSLALTFDAFNKNFVLTVKGAMNHQMVVGPDPFGNITRLTHTLEAMPEQLAEAQTGLETVKGQLQNARAAVEQPFPQEEELAKKLEDLARLNALLDLDQKPEPAEEMVEEPLPVVSFEKWLWKASLPYLMDTYGLSERRARSQLMVCLTPEQKKVLVFSAKDNPQGLDDARTQERVAKLTGSDYYAIPVNEDEHLIVPKPEHNPLVYLRSVLGQCNEGLLASMKQRTAFEYDMQQHRSVPFDHHKVIRGLLVEEEAPGYHARHDTTRQPRPNIR